MNAKAGATRRWAQRPRRQGTPEGGKTRMKETFRFTLNDKPTELTSDKERMLLWVLRTELGLTGPKYGCGEGFCGACTVLVDKEAVRACQFPIESINGKKVITIEGVSRNGNLHPLQKAFMTHDAMQCGFCTSGMIMNAYGLLLKNPRPTRAEIVEGMDGNLCRCGSYRRIIEAIQTAAEEMKGGMNR
jgi:aerobic-type carbon monoxide dehydrogenase small subunit (CoxS/CutS family)